MTPKLHEFAVNLQRDGPHTPWGIRLVGGSDLDTPLIITRVQLGSPAYGEVLRGDIISKVGEYDARDLMHVDAQTLFKGAGNEIKLVVHRGPSPFLPGPGHYEHAMEQPVQSLPVTVFPNLNESGGYNPPTTSCFSPMPTRDHQQDVLEEQAAIVNQPYRTTPLVLPGAKAKKGAPSTDSYLRHYPNPKVRAHPGQDYNDILMKQRVADTMLHKVVGAEADSGKVFHKQFNSPIGLYSDNNIEQQIRQTVPINGRPLYRPLPTKIDGYKKTVTYDPSKSDTYRAIQEEGYGDYLQEIPTPVQPRVFHPNRMVPGRKPAVSPRPPSSASYHVVNNAQDDSIRQSGSFNRLMYSVLGTTDY